jgi:hypothetical protein
MPLKREMLAAKATNFWRLKNLIGEMDIAFNVFSWLLLLKDASGSLVNRCLKVA